MDELQPFLADYPESVREIALKTRDLILQTLPGVIEVVDVPSRIVAYGYDRTYRGLICAIAPQKNYVNLMFSRGAALADPAGLLTGTGKRARHVKLGAALEVDNPALTSLLLAARAAHQRR